MPQPIEIPPLREMKGRATARLRNEGRWARFSKRRLWYKDQLKKRNGLVSDALNEASWACALGEFPALKVGDGCDLPAGVEVAREAVSSGVEGSGSSPVAGSSEVGGVEVLTLPSALGRLVRRDGVTVPADVTPAPVASESAAALGVSFEAKGDEDEGPGPDNSAPTGTMEDWARQVLWAYDNLTAWPRKKKREAPTNGAWLQFQFADRNRAKFMQDSVPKALAILGKAAAAETAEGKHDLAQADKIKGLLGKLVAEVEAGSVLYCVTCGKELRQESQPVTADAR